MELTWQDIIALTLVSLAAVYLALRGWRLFATPRGGQGCSTCGSCSGKATGERSMVSLQIPSKASPGK